MLVDTQSADAIRRVLGDWFRLKRRSLPWRETNDPYRIWVSEVMLQQTQVKTVVPYYRRFMVLYPTVQHLACADTQAVLKAWEGLGYYSRARNLQKAARIVVEQLEGRIPDQWQPLRQLPGVGDYIAAAVLSIAFDRPFAVVDGNVKRVLARLFMIAEPVNRSASHKVFQALADQLLDAGQAGNFNQAMMELGALICTPRAPLCAQCPPAPYCRAAQSGAVARYPFRAPRPKTPEHALAVGLVRKQGRVLIVRRPDEGLLGGLWEFPAIRIEPAVDPAEACTRHLRTTFNLSVRVERHAATIRHAYTHFKIRMEVFVCDWHGGDARCSNAADHQWVDPEHVGRFALHRAAQKALSCLLTASL